MADLRQTPASVIRLPYDAEWVKMAGGSEGERYPWDKRGQPVTSMHDTNQIIARANVDRSEIGQTSPVGMYPQGASHPFGLRDMGGNVWEWTNSWYSEKQRGRVVRGGSFGNHYRGARVSFRNYYVPYDAYLDLGFRPVAPGSGS